jgi:hypothetical protein
MEKKTKAVYIPKRGRNDNFRYVAINGKRMLIKCGEVVEVPADFAAVIEQSRKQDAESDEYIASKRRED